VPVIGRCNTVILDTQNLRGAPLVSLERLRKRGFRIHVSNVALEEFWAQAYREGNPRMLTARIARLVPLVDPDAPVKTAGANLVQRLGGTVRGELVPTGPGQTEALRYLWGRLAANTMPESELAEGAREMEAAAVERAAEWKQTVALAADVPGWNDASVPERVIARGVAELLYKKFDPDLEIPGGMRERFEGYYLVAGLHAARSKRRMAGLLPKVDENDAEDLQVLMHLAEGFVATNDRSLVEHVDSSGTFQAPWVRTIGELLASNLPQGKPWGDSARRAAAKHKSRSPAGLRAFDELEQEQNRDERARRLL
jgi:hypothetical protein